MKARKEGWIEKLYVRKASVVYKDSGKK